MITLLLAAASAYEIKDDTWTWDPEPDLEIRVNTSSFPASWGSTTAVTAAIEEGATSWNGHSGMHVEVGAPTDTERRLDGIMSFYYEAEEVHGAVLAVARGWGENGNQYDCDVTFFQDNEVLGAIDWGLSDSSAIDVVEVAAHEFGHCLGFAHSSNDNALMRTSLRGWRSLHSDDINGLEHLYAVEDDDNDGAAADDCRDDLPDVHPGAPEICDGLDNDCDGILDEVLTSVVDFGPQVGSPLVRGNGGLFGVFDVQQDTALVSFSQRFEVLYLDQRVSFSVVDITGGSQQQLWTKTAMATAGQTEVHSPVMSVRLEAGHRYAIGAVAVIAGSYQQGTPTDVHGLVPLGGVLQDYVPDDAAGWSIGHGIPDLTLELSDEDLDGDGATAMCGDCDDEDPSTTCGAPTYTPPPPPSSNNGGSGGGCASLQLYGTAMGAPLVGMVVGRRRREQ